MTIGFPRFTKQFASGGTVTALSDAQAAAGWAFLGSAPPTVEEFNAMMQSFDDKDNWLFNNIQTLVTAAGSDAPADGVFTALQTALNVLYAPKNLVTDTGGVNAYVAAFTPVLAAPVPGSPFWMLVKTTNTGASTLAGSTAGASPLVGGAHQPLQGGELIANGWALIDYNASINSYVLLECTGASIQIGAATKSLHAAQFGQIPGIVGAQMNLSAVQLAAAKTATWTADFVSVGAVKGGPTINVPNVNLSINTAIVGANGMLVGAPVVSSFVGVYLLYNPTTNTAILGGVNAIVGAMPMICAAAGIPPGYTYSALISSLWTDASGNFRSFVQSGRIISNPGSSPISSIGAPTAITGFIWTGVPPEAVNVSGYMVMQNSASGSDSGGIHVNNLVGLGSIFCNRNMSAAGGVANSFSKFPLNRTVSPVTSYVSTTSSSGTSSFTITVTQYEV